MVTADVPSGSIRPTSSQRARRAVRRSRPTPVRRSPWRSRSRSSRTRSEFRIASVGGTKRPLVPVDPSARYHVEAVSTGPRTTFDERQQREPEQHEHHGEVDCRGARVGQRVRTVMVVSSRRRRRRRTASRAASAAVTSSSSDDRDELHERERGGTWRSSSSCGLPVDLDLERRVARSTEQQHDAERGEREEEHDRAAAAIAGAQQRQRRSRGTTASGSAEHPRRLRQPRVEVRPEASDDRTTTA